MKLSIVTLLAGLGVGFVAGYWVSPDGQEAGLTGSPERAQVVATSSGHGEAGQAEAGPVRVLKRVRVPAKRDFADVAACTREVERLAATVEQLTDENAEHKKHMEYETGTAITFPKKLDPKYLEPALMRNLNKAFEEVGLDGDVSFVDCDEFPCIVCAGLGADQGEEMDMNETMQKLRKLNDSEAMSAYEESQRRNTVMVRREENDGGTSRTLNNCQAIYPDPKDAQLREQLEKRLTKASRRILKILGV